MPSPSLLVGRLQPRPRDWPAGAGPRAREAENGPPPTLGSRPPGGRVQTWAGGPCRSAVPAPPRQNWGGADTARPAPVPAGRPPSATGGGPGETAPPPAAGWWYRPWPASGPPAAAREIGRASCRGRV